MSTPRVVVVHDYLTQRGGAERVVLELLEAFPGSRLVTSCWDKDGTYPEFGAHDVTTLWPDRLPFLRRDPRRALPVLAAAFSRYVVEDADVVLCSSSGWAHGVGSTAPKVVYCHNPPRWLHQPGDYLGHLPKRAHAVFARVTRPLHRWDAAAAADATRYLANSTVVADRIRRVYDIDAAVVPPPRGLDPDGPREPIVGVEPGFLLTVGRPRGYKNTEVVCEAVAGLRDERLVVVGGLPEGEWPERLTGLTGISDAQLRWLYAHCAGLVAVAREDFGLTPVEAQAFGRPSVVLRSGGYLDSTVEGVTGVFVDAPQRELVRDGIRELRNTAWDPLRIRALGERFSPARFATAIQAAVADPHAASAPAAHSAPAPAPHAASAPAPHSAPHAAPAPASLAAQSAQSAGPAQPAPAPAPPTA